jgi:anti-sigma B factor antagonist
MPGAFGDPHVGHARASGLPQPPQNFASAGFSVPQVGQTTYSAYVGLAAFAKSDVFSRRAPREVPFRWFLGYRCAVARDHPGLLTFEVTKPDPDVWLVALLGELDPRSSPAVPAKLQRLVVEGPARIVVDLSGLSFVDSSGMNALVASERAVSSAGGSVVFAAPTDQVRRVFDLVRLTDVLVLEESVEAAVARVGLAPGGAE